MAPTARPPRSLGGCGCGIVAFAARLLQRRPTRGMSRRLSRASDAIASNDGGQAALPTLHLSRLCKGDLPKDADSPRRQVLSAREGDVGAAVASFVMDILEGTQEATEWIGSTLLNLGGAATESIASLAGAVGEALSPESERESDAEVGGVAGSPAVAQERVPYALVPRLQERATDIALLPSGRVRLPLLRPRPEGARLGADGLPHMHFDHWMDGTTIELEPTTFFVDYDDTDTSFTYFGTTYGPQRLPGDAYTMRPYLAVFERRWGLEWVAEDFMANFEVRFWDYELGYVTKIRPDTGIALSPEFVGRGPGGELRYRFFWMQAVTMEVVKLPGDGPLELVQFNGAAVAGRAADGANSGRQPLFRLSSGWSDDRGLWYVAPLTPEGHPQLDPAWFKISWRGCLTLLNACLRAAA